MTQEDKAKRYDELLLKLQKAKVDDNVCDEMYYRVIDDIVPELKESEDEKIRESIIENLKGNMCRTDGDYDLLNKQIAWLEKQHIQKQEINYPKFDFDDILALQCCMETAEKVTEDKELYKKLQSLHSRLHDAYWLEKQGEQKQDPCEHCADKRLNCHNFPCVKKRAFEQGKSILEAINEEKVDNANKVEQKFHEGEWLCENEPNNYARFIQILEIVNVLGKERYRISRDIHNDEDIVEFDFVEKYYHKFDIKDAKAGDILYTPKGLGVEGIFLVSGWQQIEGTGKTLCSNIGYRVDDDEIVEGGLGAIWWKGVVDPFYPATKEQRDTLEKAMAGVGYTFDKKELKKIEQNPTWSEEDEAMLDEIIDFFENGTVKLQHDLSLYASWLKSLKGRVGCEANCTTTKEWSEEDENIKEWIMSDINKLLALNRKSFVIADKELNWLKSIKIDTLGSRVMSR